MSDSRAQGRTPRPFLLGVCLAVLGCGPAARETCPSTMPASGVARVPAATARAVLRLPEPNASQALPEVLGVAPPPSAAQILEGWALVPRTEEVRSAAGREVGSRIEPADVVTTAHGREVELVVQGDGAEAAIARCLALVRATRVHFDAPADAARAFLTAERARTLERLRELERSLADVAPGRTPRASGGGSVETWRDELQRELAALRGANATVDSISSSVAFSGLSSLSARYQEALAMRVDARARGLGDAHPEVATLSLRIEALQQAIEAQKRLEISAREETLAELERAARAAPRDPNAVSRTRARVLRARLAALASTPSVGVASDAPIGLQLRAIAYREVALERQALGARYGAQHPRMVALAAELTELARAFATSCQQELAALDLELVSLDGASRRRQQATPLARAEEDERVSRARAEREHLVELVALLESRADTATVSALEVSSPCGLR